MADVAERSVGRSLADYQAGLKASGRSFSGELARRYAERWTGGPPRLCPCHPHDTTHSMIYSKMLACFNPAIEGIFVDSPNIRLELRRKGRIGEALSRDEPETVSALLALERALGREAGTQFFWVLGLFRENYDLVDPFAPGDAKRGVPSERVYNYDLCAAARHAAGSLGEAYEVLSGGLREWLYPAIVARLLDNGVIPEPPRSSPEGGRRISRRWRATAPSWRPRG